MSKILDDKKKKFTKGDEKPVNKKKVNPKEN